MDIDSVAVVGAGFMGGGVAQVCAQAGLGVRLIDVAEDRLEKAQKAIRWSVEKLVSKGRLDEPADAILERLATSTSLDATADADLVIEAVFEDFETKKGVFRALNGLCKPGAILGSNTSTIPITQIAGTTDRADRVIGVHFFGPVPLMRLVEIIPNPKTSQDVVDTILEFGRRVGKRPILVKKDVPGFLMNRIFGGMTFWALKCLEDGIGSAQDIDQGLCDGFNLNVGPLEIADRAGIDITFHAMRVPHELEPENMPAPPAILERMIGEGKLGVKTGEGFFRYDEHGKRLAPVE